MHNNNMNQCGTNHKRDINNHHVPLMQLWFVVPKRDGSNVANSSFQGSQSCPNYRFYSMLLLYVTIYSYRWYEFSYEYKFSIKFTLCLRII
jgi:hypothetical protein